MSTCIGVSYFKIAFIAFKEVDCSLKQFQRRVTGENGNYVD